MKNQKLVLAFAVLLLGSIYAHADGHTGVGGGAEAVVRKLDRGMMEIEIVDGAVPEKHMIKISDWVCLRGRDRTNYILHQFAFGRSADEISKEMVESDKACSEALAAERRDKSN